MNVQNKSPLPDKYAFTGELIPLYGSVTQVDLVRGHKEKLNKLYDLKDYRESYLPI